MTGHRELSVTSTDAARLQVEIHGPEDAPTIVLAHGWTCQARVWQPVLRLLVPDHRVVLYDQRGHGRSTATPGRCSPRALADDLCAVLAATVPAGRRAVLGGHSMGAMAIVAAADRPELRGRAAAVLLCSTGVDQLSVDQLGVGRPVAEPGAGPALPATGPGPRSGVAPGGARRAARLTRSLTRRLLATSLPYGPVTPLSRRVIHGVTLGPDAGRELGAVTARMVHACPRRARAEWGRVLGVLDVAEKVALLDQPVTIIHGRADRLTPPPHARRIAQRLPRAPVLIELDRVGHMTPLEAPETVAGALREQVRAARLVEAAREAEADPPKPRERRARERRAEGHAGEAAAREAGPAPGDTARAEPGATREREQ